MNVLLLGNGGREHAIAKKIAQSKRLKKLYSIPGNPGISQLAEIAEIDPDDLESVINFAKKSKIDLIISGPEKPLVDGIADLAAKENILVFGPRKMGAMLEGSKTYSKQFMIKYNIPTSPFKSFTDYNSAATYLANRHTFPLVIKADGLAAGKGVKLAESKEEALNTVEQYMVKKIHGDAGNSIIIEDFLIGEEMSFLYITDGKTFIPLLPAKDYKKAFDGDKGENTGGMGSYAPHVSINDELKKKIDKEIVEKIKTGFKEENFDYKGVLYIGLMLTDEGPKVLEFNCRFGDPETQVILPLIENDLLEIIHAAAKGKLETHSIKWKNDYAACVVIASGGYPGEYKKGLKIDFDIDPFEIIHAGTKYQGKNIVTSGGRVLNCVALGCSKSAAIENAYKLAEKVHFEKGFYRKDIGK
jgi:phosphoribosylamine---glycine ligase